MSILRMYGCGETEIFGGSAPVLFSIRQEYLDPGHDREKLMKHWWTSWLIIFILAILPSIALSEPPARPPPDTAISWDVHRSLGVVMVFKTDHGLLYFAHPVLITELVSECRGITWGTEEETIALLEMDTTGVPAKYTVLKTPIAYRWESGKWESMLMGRYCQ